MRLRVADRSLLCIDWDERSLRVIDVTVTRAAVKIHHAVHVPFPAEFNTRDPAATGAFIRKTLAEHRIRTRKAIVDIQRQDSVLNLMMLPSGTTDELAAMIHIQVGKDLPFSKDQAVIDFAIAPQADSPTLPTWVAAVRSNVIDRYQEIARAAGLRLERIGLRPYANLAAFTADGGMEGRLLTVDVGASMTELSVVRDGKLAYSRAASVNVPDEGLMAAPPEAPPRPRSDSTIPLVDDFVPRQRPIDSLLVEVSRTIEAYRATDPGARIDRVLLAGSGGVDQKVAQAFEDRFGSPAVIFELPRALTWKRGRDQSAAVFSACIGLALSSAGERAEHFDFLHPKQPEEGRRERARRVPVLVGLAALLVIAGGLAAYRPMFSLGREIALLESQIREKEKIAKDREVKDFNSQLAEVASWSGDSVVVLDEIQRLAAVFPDAANAHLTELKFTAPGKFDVSMVAVDEEQGTDFVARVRQIKDPDGDQRYTAVPGDLKNSDDPKYRYQDRVTVQIKDLIPQPKNRRSR